MAGRVKGDRGGGSPVGWAPTGAARGADGPGVAHVPTRRPDAADKSTAEHAIACLSVLSCGVRRPERAQVFAPGPPASQVYAAAARGSCPPGTRWEQSASKPA